MKNKPMQVLLFEDNPGDARLFREFLLEGGLEQVELDHVDRLKTGLEHLAQRKPDIILLDLGLPDSQGLQTFAQVYAHAQDVPIVVLTGLNDTEKTVEAVRTGAQDYLVKGEISGGLLSRSIRYAIERKTVEQALRALSKRNEAILSAIPDIIMEVDTYHVYTWANQAGLDFFGSDVIGHEANFYFEDDQDVYSLVQPLFDGTNDLIFVEDVQRRRDGEKRRLAWWCRVLKDDTGNVTGALSTSRDITERRQAEDKIRQQLEELLRWQNLTLGRESRLLELKHEINDLHRRLNEPPRYPSAEKEPPYSQEKA